MRTVINTKEDKSNTSLDFLYNTVFGRAVLKVITRPFVSKFVGGYMNTPLSRRRINSFISDNNIDMSQYDDRKYKSYNDFFTRKILDGKRDVDKNSDSLISPCDSKLSVYKIDDDTAFSIKGSKYTLSSFLKNDDLAREFCGGYIFIFRLTVDDYHRYCYVDSGEKTDNVYIKGLLHTVQPIALSVCDIYHENCREYTIIESENFGKIIQAEVGALLVGKIKNHHGKCYVNKGDEKGMFEFGGSTCVLVVKRDVVEVDEELISNTEKELETVVKYGERIAKKNKQI